jgi:hypothetical protein
MSNIYLTPNHPYLRHAKPSVYKGADKWIVKWRDFLSMKQDAEFATKREAEEYASGVMAEAHIVDMEWLENWGEGFDDVTKWWASI